MNEAQLKAATEELTDFVAEHGIGLTLNILTGICMGCAKVSKNKKKEFIKAAELITDIGVPIQQLGL